MKILVVGNLHHKNRESLEKILKYLNFDYKFGDINEVKKFKVIISPNIPINTSIFPNKFFIFGPHFSVFPNQLLYKINNVHKNSIYLQPSEWALNVWKKFNVESIIPLKVFYFPVNTDKFIPLENIKKEKVFIYFKRRKQEELTFLKTFLHNKNIEFKVFDYVKRYEEEDYLKYLQKSNYGIILDAHESQGFAIEEALSCNVPLLVWNVTSMNQEEGINYPDIPATSIPYWDDRCGEYFYKKEEFEEKYKEFVSKLDTYKPREYVLENLGLDKCAENFKKLIK